MAHFLPQQTLFHITVKCRDVLKHSDSISVGSDPDDENEKMSLSTYPKSFLCMFGLLQ